MRAIDLLDSLKSRGFAVHLDGGHLAVSPASKIDDATRDAIRACKSQLLQFLAADMAWPDAGSDPVLIWCHRVVKGGIELPAKVSFVEGISPVVVDPTEYIIDKLQVLRWIRSSIAVGGIGQWTPAWFTATAARLRENLAALKAVSETSVPGKQGAKKGR